MEITAICIEVVACGSFEWDVTFGLHTPFGRQAHNNFLRTNWALVKKNIFQFIKPI